MMLVRSRLVAGALGLAVAGTTTGAVIARADDSAPRAQAAQSTGGLSITPAVVEQTAKKGNVGSFTVKNTTKDTLKVTVTVRPWVQNRSTAAVAINKTANLSPYVIGSPSSFTLAPGLARRHAEDAPPHRRAARSTAASRSSPSRSRPRPATGSSPSGTWSPRFA